MFESLLIANRGEIARRIIRTARRMGLRTIAVYSDADAAAPHVAEADEAVRIGPAAARDSYLRIDAILEAARQTGAQAIHPGYGFLSERPDFPAACAAAGIAFVGPPAEVVAAMGSKIAAKRLAVAAGVPVVPGFDADTGDDAALVAAAASVGFPLLVKASAGGGGKGMRVVEGAGDMAEAIATARREAKAAFGDDRLLLERLVRSARHVEVQVAADHHGAVVHLFERDCSVQRNNQKIFEEAPAPNLPDAIRSRLYDDAVRLARSIGYRNLGTMEFLVDAATGEHFFLEMNTRLQVEHPVTEMITGLDLVEWQLRIAAGEPLPLPQEAIRASGHAIEARLLAERPEAGFMPASRRVALWREPAPRPGLRIDSGIATGSEITVHYDSMVAKVIAHGATRDAARQALIRGLSDLTVLGPDTNRAFLVDVAAHGPFAEGQATTAMLRELFPDGWTRPALTPDRAAGIAAAVIATTTRTASSSPWNALRGFRVLAPAGRPAVQEFTVTLDGARETARILFDGKTLALVTAEGPLAIHVEGNPSVLSFRIAGDSRRGTAVVEGETVTLRLGEAEWRATVETALDAHQVAGAGGAGSDTLLAPMPGIVAEVKVAPGDVVEAGQPLVVIESMKLFQTLAAPRAGTIATVAVTAGETVPAGHRLVALAPDTTS
jgi:3-methylcrotonyl-CoA carboxylase alpha subunit